MNFPADISKTKDRMENKNENNKLNVAVSTTFDNLKTSIIEGDTDTFDLVFCLRGRGIRRTWVMYSCHVSGENFQFS